MLFKIHYFGLAIFSMACLFPVAGNASNKDLNVSVSASTSFETHSNVALSQIDESLDNSDTALMSALDITASWESESQLMIDAGGNFTDRKYATFEDFNTRSYTGFLDIAQNLGMYTIGAGYFAANVEVDNEELLALKQTQIYFARLLGNKWYVKFDAAFNEKDFELYSSRNGDNQEYSFSVFYFPENWGRYVSLATGYINENTNANEFNYTGAYVGANYYLISELANQPFKVNLSASWKEKDYEGSGLSPEIDAPGFLREDNRITGELGLEWSVFNWLALTSSASYISQRSNLPLADYDEAIYAIGLKVTIN